MFNKKANGYDIGRKARKPNGYDIGRIGDTEVRLIENTARLVFDIFVVVASDG